MLVQEKTAYFLVAVSALDVHNIIHLELLRSRFAQLDVIGAHFFLEVSKASQILIVLNGSRLACCGHFFCFIERLRT